MREEGGFIRDEVFPNKEGFTEEGGLPVWCDETFTHNLRSIKRSGTTFDI